MADKKETEKKKAAAKAAPTDPPPVKKKPGRPKKQAIVIQEPSYGIMDKPYDQGNTVEWVYSDTQIIQKIISLFKNFGSSCLQICFNERSICISADDQTKKNIIVVNIDAQHMKYYYRREPKTIYIMRDSLDIVLNIISPTTDKISFILPRAANDKYIFMVIRDAEVGSNEQYEVKLSQPQQVPDLRVSDPSDYPFSCEFPSSYFKKKVKNILPLSNDMIISIRNGDEMEIRHSSNGDHHSGQIKSTSIYEDKRKINVKSSLPRDDLVAVTVNLNNLEPFSSSKIGKKVILYVDKTKRLLFESRPDEKEGKYAISIKIYAEIVLSPKYFNKT